MANIKSAKKRVLISEKKTARNKALKTSLKTVIKKADFALVNSAEDRDVAVKAAIRKIDSSVAKGILHKNTAARKKSALTRKLNTSNAG